MHVFFSKPCIGELVKRGGVSRGSTPLVTVVCFALRFWGAVRELNSCRWFSQLCRLPRPNDLQGTSERRTAVSAKRASWLSTPGTGEDDHHQYGG